MQTMGGPQARLPAPGGSHKHSSSESLLEWASNLEAMQPVHASGDGRLASLPVETVAVTVAAIVGIRFLNVPPAAELKWLLIPCLLVVAALLPTWLRGRPFPSLGLDREHAGVSLALVSITGLCVIPAVFLGLWLMVRIQLPVPLRPVVAGPEGWLTWLIYQFLYVAVAEEMFFRGYLQANVTNWLADTRPAGQYIAVIVSAGCFALAHAIVQGQITSLFTFLPGLILAWLFLRTRSLLAPILFHGLANVSYGIIALIVT